jgi:hypothetical protein
MGLPSLNLEERAGGISKFGGADDRTSVSFAGKFDEINQQFARRDQPWTGEREWF